MAQAPTANVEIYVIDYCPYCDRAKQLLDRKKVAYQEINVDGNSEKRRWLAQVTGQRTVPQIFIGGKPVGGCDDLHALDRAGRLDPLLAKT